MEIVIAFALGALVGMVACAAWMQWVIGALSGMVWGTRGGRVKGAVPGLELPNFRSPPAAPALPAAIQWMRLVTSGLPGQALKGYRRPATRPKKRLRLRQ